MSNFESISQELQSCLDLQYEPVGVSLFADGDELPMSMTPSGESFKSYCRALTLAGKGRSLLIGKEQLGCKLGTCALGFEDDMDRYLDDGVLEKYGVGLFATEEASANTILQAQYLPMGKTRTAYIAPLSVFVREPQVVVFTATAEQIMWLLYATNYETGGVMNLPQSGGALGGCVDITVLPLARGLVNVTFLGLGCRIKSAVDGSMLMMGMPGNAVEIVYSNIRKMAKPLEMLKQAHHLRESPTS